MDISRCKTAIYMRVATEEQVGTSCDIVYRVEPNGAVRGNTDNSSKEDRGVADGGLLFDTDGESGPLQFMG